MQILLLLGWVVLTGIWLGINWLTYIQMRPVLSLRPIAKYVFWTQVVVSVIFLLSALVFIMTADTTVSTAATPNNYGIY